MFIYVLLYYCYLAIGPCLCSVDYTSNIKLILILIRDKAAYRGLRVDPDPRVNLDLTRTRGYGSGQVS